MITAFIDNPQKIAADISEDNILNIAAMCPATRALGPGVRAAVWVQGCALHCPGCVAPDWIPIQPASLVLVDDLAHILLLDSTITGITLSGGEPMLQAAGLAQLLRVIKAERDLDVICFTGFILENLLKTPPGPGVEMLLGQVDVLIDGPYIQKLNDNTGLRGSRNQRIHHLTDRLSGFDFQNVPRKAEVHVNDGQVQLVGVPPRQLPEYFQQAVNQVNQQGWELLHHERI